MSGAHDGPPLTEPARRAVEAVWRIESARIVGALARYTGDFALAEDVAQEALAEALVTWSRDGAPASPVGWLLATARRRAIDAFRRRSARDERYALLAGQLAEGEASSGAVPARPGPDELPWDPDRIEDDVLALMFVACHPVLPPEARVALTLRTVGGLTSEEIARAFLVPVPTIQARITRAKKTIAAARVPFELPPPEQRPDRLGGVLSVLYVIFTEGSTATAGDDLLRPDLAYEAIRLARTLTALLPGEPEAHGLLALCELTAARFPARTGPDGEPVLLEDQDRRRWDTSAIRRGLAALDRATAAGRGLGPYGLQAAIAACHATAASVPETDWDRVVLLYEALGRIAPSPVVDLNRAVAVAMAHGPAAGLSIVDDLVAADRLPGSHLLPGVRGELLTRLGRTTEARAELELAARLCRNARERSVLLRKAAALG
ncbi:RNA polymerase sigma factor [Spirilliplanes yamanashiensis]|uniref:RNA polymerase sigma factor n=1 Tax=Spirilliplanes yamanashiensis TaxID=42233 RepID=A0A8J4DJW8_9ACTN|nr:RNA polymerase sigma factor [Spirilliplanes yamanashiensis]MDP9817822.1 RNA polymerase sigma factor (sigma-70 family) [Spirilliplanes yamanashiensis]GIJ04632.1 RNA polymerase sigma factor [Spirilliplanes yamanashiensis]